MRVDAAEDSGRSQRRAAMSAAQPMPRIVSLESAFSPTQDVISSYMNEADKSGGWTASGRAPGPRAAGADPELSARVAQMRGLRNRYSTSSDAISKWLLSRAQWQGHTDAGTQGWNALALHLPAPHDLNSETLSPITTTTEVDSLGLSTPTLISNRGTESMASPMAPGMLSVMERTASSLSSGIYTERRMAPPPVSAQTLAPQVPRAAYSESVSDDASPRTAREQPSPETGSTETMQADRVPPEMTSEDYGDATLRDLNMPTTREVPMKSISPLPGAENEALSYLRNFSSVDYSAKVPTQHEPTYGTAPQLPEAQEAVVGEDWSTAGRPDIANTSQGSWVLSASESEAMFGAHSPPPPLLTGSAVMRNFERMEPPMSLSGAVEALRPVADSDAYVLDEGLRGERWANTQQDQTPPQPPPKEDVIVIEEEVDPNETIPAPALDTSVLQHVNLRPGSEAMPVLNIMSGMFEERADGRYVPVLHEVAPTSDSIGGVAPPVDTTLPWSPAPQIDVPGGTEASPVPWTSATFFDTVMERAATDFDLFAREPGLQIKPLFHGRRRPSNGLTMRRRDPNNLFFRNGPPHSLDCSPVDQLNEFSYIVDDEDAEESAFYVPATVPEEVEPEEDAPPTLPPLNFDIDVDEPPPRRTRALGTYDDDDSVEISKNGTVPTKLPLDFITKPDSLLARGRPVKKRGNDPVFYGSDAAPLRRTDYSEEPEFYAPPDQPPKPVEEMNFYERLEWESELEARAVEAAVAAEREQEELAAQTQPQGQSHAPDTDAQGMDLAAYTLAYDQQYGPGAYVHAYDQAYGQGAYAYTYDQTYGHGAYARAHVQATQAQAQAQPQAQAPAQAYTDTTIRGVQSNSGAYSVPSEPESPTRPAYDSSKQSRSTPLAWWRRKNGRKEKKPTATTSAEEPPAPPKKSFDYAARAREMPTEPVPGVQDAQQAGGMPHTGTAPGAQHTGMPFSTTGGAYAGADTQHAAGPDFAAPPPNSAKAAPKWTRMGTPRGRQVRLPQVEPTEPGKYCLDGTASLPILHVARTPEQRRRGETGYPGTELRRIQGLLADPSGSTDPARAGIIKTAMVPPESVPPPGKIMVVEERKVIVRPVM